MIALSSLPSSCFPVILGQLSVHWWLGGGEGARHLRSLSHVTFFFFALSLGALVSGGGGGLV